MSAPHDRATLPKDIGASTIMGGAALGEVRDGFSLDDAICAHALMRPWWRALGTDDDAALRRLTHPGSVGDPGPGLAGRLRDDLGVSVEQCAAMGVFNTVSILGDGAWAFYCKTGVRTSYERPIVSRRHALESPAGGAAHGWLIRVDRADDGSWRVWGWTPDAEAVDKVILPPLTPADPPIVAATITDRGRGVPVGPGQTR